MSKSKRTGHTARIAALERDVLRLRAQLPKEIHHAARFELRAALKERDADKVQTQAIGFRMDLGRDSYSEDG